MFVGIIIHNYLQSDVTIRLRITAIVEMLYLTTVGIFSMMALLILQAILGYMEHFDPNFKISKFLIPISFTNSTLTSSQDSLILSLSNSSIVIVIFYFVVLFVFYKVRQMYQEKESRDSHR